MQETDRPRVIRVAAVLSGVCVGLIFIASLVAGGDETDSIPSAEVKSGDVRITLSESGELRAEHQATIQATNDKMIVWMAPEGAWVKKGDPLVELDASKYDIQRSGARSGLEMAKAGLESAFSDLEGHKNAARMKQLDYETLRELAEKGFVDDNEVENARLANEEVRSARRSFEAAVTAARANVERAQQEVNQAQRKFDLGAMVAPRDGLVVYAHVGDPGSNRKVQVGMTPFEGMDLMYLPDLSSMIVETEISEVDLARVVVGSKAELRLDAYPDLVFRGEVTLVSGLARPKVSRVTGKPTGIKVFDVTIAVLDVDERLKPGLTVTADILVNAYEEALYIPIAAVFLDELDRTIAYVDARGGVEPRPIEVADSSDRVAVVTNGLELGEEVLLGLPTTL
jgi:HlyD family secretion protein